LALDGVILTKLDGDARGGAALSVKEVVGKPIAFASTGEKLDDFDLFHPDRLAGRILGMGDVPHPHREGRGGLRRASRPRAAAHRLLEGQFTLEDFLEQMAQVKKMGNLGNLMKLMPGMPKELRNTEIDDRELAKIEGIIHSMTRPSAATPSSSTAPVACASPTAAASTHLEVNALLKQFTEMQKMMKGLGGGLLGRSAAKKAKKKGKGGGGRTTPKGGGKPTLTLPPGGGAPAGGAGGFRLPGV
jgi:signal recognition particle subunit SRP54